MTDPRILAFNSLLSCNENGRYSNLEADTVLSRFKLSERDRNFYTTLFYGTIEKQITLDYQISKLSSTSISKIQPHVLVLLRMGIYQLLFMNGVPDHAAIFSTVEIAKSKANKGAVSFINALLRSASRKLLNPDRSLNLMTPKKDRDPHGFLSVYYSYPRFLCKLWSNAYGADTAEKIMIAQNAKPPVTLRINTLKTSRDNYLNILSEKGFSAAPSPLTDDGVVLQNANVTSLPFFDEGYFFVQDDASRIALSSLKPVSGDSVIDVCSAPGGKSFAAAISMNNSGRILSFDLHENKLSLIRNGAKRLGISIISAKQADSSVFLPELLNSADKIICDVPCSGFGTISKKPDLRLKKYEDTLELPDIQHSILQNCSRYLKPKGTLMYSTCTLNPAENEGVLSRFIESNPNFKIYSSTTLFPHINNTDGFFFALVLRK